MANNQTPDLLDAKVIGPIETEGLPPRSQRSRREPQKPAKNVICRVFPRRSPRLCGSIFFSIGEKPSLAIAKIHATFPLMSNWPLAVLFDFDGVIVNSEPLHCRAFQQVLRDENIQLSDQEYYADLVGFDISKHGLECAKEEVKHKLFHYKAQDRYPFGDKSFDLVISLATLHNLRLFELQTALQEIERVGKNKYVMLESYRNELELFNLECWALTAESFFDTAEWIWLYNHFGYTGDYEFIYFE